MDLKKIYLSWLFLWMVSLSVVAQNQAIKKISIDDLKRNLTFLSSDSLYGRRLGTAVNGLDIAADYLASEAKNIGLEQLTPNYFQQVDMISTKPLENNFIQIENKNGEIEFKTQDIINLGNQSENINLQNTEVEIIGFWDKTDSLADYSNKIVVVSQSDKKVFSEGKEFRWNGRLEREKIKQITKTNPKAILFVTLPGDEKNTNFFQIKSWINRERFSLKKSSVDENVTPVLLVLPAFADKLFGKKASWEKYLKKKSKNKISKISTPTKQITINVENNSHRVAAKNVVGFIKGADVNLKDECVVFMAHYDHLGVSKNGDVYNGADDNGSGTVSLLAIARAFKNLKTPPKRSILFLWVTCEEIGMLGSEYYTNNPLIDLDKTVLCINIDMDGRVYEPRDSVWKDSPKKVKNFEELYTLANATWPELKNITTTKCKKLGLIPDFSLPERFLRSSDHYHFHKNNIPILNLATGYHADYHKVTDEIDKINFEKMQKVAQLSFLVGLEVANKKTINIQK